LSAGGAAGQPSAAAQPRSPADLFTAFTWLALQGFGGVLAVAQHELVDRRRWLTRAEFAESLSVGQVLPGPNVVNMALMIGDRFFGWRGALAAMSGILALPLVIVLTLAMLYGRIAATPMAAGAIRGMGAVAAGLVFAMAIKLAPTLKSSPLPLRLCAAATLLTWLLVGVVRVPLVWVVLGVGGAMVAFAWHWLGRR
jgi:chromate transporter